MKWQRIPNVGEIYGLDEETQEISAPTTTETTVYKFPEITYSSAGELDYKGQHFQGNEISVVDSSIGKQVSVNIARGVDTSTTFTLLLPNGLIQNDAKITAVGITTFRVFPRLGTNSYTLLHGTVSSRS